MKINTSDVQAVILAGGKGTRMGETEIPKVLHLLHGKPLITYLLDNLHELTWNSKPVIVVGFKREQVMQVLGPMYLYAIQEDQLGTAHAVISAKSVITAKHIVVLYGDMPFITGQSIQRLVALHCNMNSKLTMATTTVPGFAGLYQSLEKYGRIIRDSNNAIVAIREFKDADATEKNILELNPGIYVFDADWLWGHIEEITTENVQHEYYLTDTVALAIASGIPIQSISVNPAELLGVNTLSELEIAHMVPHEL